MVRSRNYETVWIDKREISNTIAGLRNGINKLNEFEVQDEDLKENMYLAIHRLKEHELDQKLFFNINSYIGAIAFGIPEVKFNDGKEELEFAHKNGWLAASLQFANEDTEFFVGDYKDDLLYNEYETQLKL